MDANSGSQYVLQKKSTKMEWNGCNIGQTWMDSRFSKSFSNMSGWSVNRFSTKKPHRCCCCSVALAPAFLLLNEQLEELTAWNWKQILS